MQAEPATGGNENLAIVERIDRASHRNGVVRRGLLYDDAGHRMIPTHATKAGIRYRYYVSLPHLKGELASDPKVFEAGFVEMLAIDPPA